MLRKVRDVVVVMCCVVLCCVVLCCVAVSQVLCWDCMRVYGRSGA